MKFWLGVFAIWAVPSAIWMTFAAIHGRLVFEGMGWRETLTFAPPLIFAAFILAVLWVFDRWPNGKS